MEKLVILDYSTCEVHIYNVDRDAEIDDEYIGNLGYKLSQCSYMFAEDIDIFQHKGVLK